MTNVSDMELLQNYDRQGSEDSFAELVRRHINLVYSAALRHVGNTAHAEEVTQAVFVILARKAAGLRPDTLLEGWLYETTRLTSFSFRRGERRRQFREQEAYMQSTLDESHDVSIWNQLSPCWMKPCHGWVKRIVTPWCCGFSRKKICEEVAAAMNVTEAAAQRRVHRALEKLHCYLTKRGYILDHGNPRRGDFGLFGSSRAGGVGKGRDGCGDRQGRNGSRFNFNPGKSNYENNELDETQIRAGSEHGRIDRGRRGNHRPF